MGKAIDLTGARFEKLTVIEKAPNRGSLVQWHCQCDCGKATEATTKKLRDGRKRSCGCLWLPSILKAKTKHGHSASGKTTAELRIWMNMRDRCNRPANPAYPRYGGRGITICNRWDAFANFFADMGARPSPSHSLDRQDNSKSYAPENCRWATKSEQARNTRRNVIVNCNGRSMCVLEAAQATGLEASTLFWRVHAGWPEDRLFQPVHR